VQEVAKISDLEALQSYLDASFTQFMKLLEKDLRKEHHQLRFELFESKQDFVPPAVF